MIYVWTREDIQPLINIKFGSESGFLARFPSQEGFEDLYAAVSDEGVALVAGLTDFKMADWLNEKGAQVEELMPPSHVTPARLLEATRTVAVQEWRQVAFTNSDPENRKFGSLDGRTLSNGHFSEAFKLVDWAAVGRLVDESLSGIPMVAIPDSNALRERFGVVASSAKDPSKVVVDEMKAFDDEMVSFFALEMQVKMGESRAKGRSGWHETSPHDLADMFVGHLLKINDRNVIDLATILMMIDHTGKDELGAVYEALDRKGVIDPSTGQFRSAPMIPQAEIDAHKAEFERTFLNRRPVERKEALQKLIEDILDQAGVCVIPYPPSPLDMDRGPSVAKADPPDGYDYDETGKLLRKCSGCASLKCDAMCDEARGSDEHVPVNPDDYRPGEGENVPVSQELAPDSSVESEPAGLEPSQALGRYDPPIK